MLWGLLAHVPIPGTSCSWSCHILVSLLPMFLAVLFEHLKAAWSCLIWNIHFVSLVNSVLLALTCLRTPSVVVQTTCYSLVHACRMIGGGPFIFLLEHASAMIGGGRFIILLVPADATAGVGMTLLSLVFFDFFCLIQCLQHWLIGGCECCM